MSDPIHTAELNERLALIEQMIIQGRRATVQWCWTFVLWGVAYFVAFAWSFWGQSRWAWPVTMLTAGVVTMLYFRRGRHQQAGTTVGRVIMSIWISAGVTLFLLFCSLGYSGHLTDAHTFTAAFAAILGLVNGALSMILRWKVQLACALGWWLAAILSCFGSELQAIEILLAAIFLFQIVFGIYGMICEARAPKGGEKLHA